MKRQPSVLRLGGLVAVAILLIVASVAAPAAAQSETTDPGECDYADGRDGQHTDEQDNADPEGDPDCHGGGEEVPPIEIIVPIRDR